MMLPRIREVGPQEMGRIVHKLPVEILELEDSIICTMENFFGEEYVMVYFIKQDVGMTVQMRTYEPETSEETDSDWYTLDRLRAEDGWK